MKVNCWNAKGVGNLNTRLTIKNPRDQQKSDLLLIVKPMISYISLLNVFNKSNLRDLHKSLYKIMIQTYDIFVQ